MTVIGLELGSQFFQLEQVGNFARQLNLFIGPQQTNATDLLQINPN